MHTGITSCVSDLDLLKKKSGTLTSTSTLCAVSYWLFGVTAAEVRPINSIYIYTSYYLRRILHYLP